MDALFANAATYSAAVWVLIDQASGRPMSLPARFAEVYGSAASGRVVSSRLTVPVDYAAPGGATLKRNKGCGLASGPIPAAPYEAGHRVWAVFSQRREGENPKGRLHT